MKKYRFYPSKAKEIAERIIAEELADALYDDSEARNWSLNISDKVREKVTGTFLYSFIDFRNDLH